MSWFHSFSLVFLCDLSLCSHDGSGGGGGGGGGGSGGSGGSGVFIASFSATLTFSGTHALWCVFYEGN